MFKAATGNSGTKTIWPFAGLICFGTGLFLIAAVIVLALIPLYVPKKDVAAVENPLMYLLYPTSSSSETGATGSVEDASSLSSSLGISDLVDVKSAEIQETAERRKRDLRTGRQRREIFHNILIICQTKSKPQCQLPSCLSAFLTKIETQIQTRLQNSIKTLSLKVSSNGNITTLTLQSTGGLSFSRSRPTTGFGQISNLTFVAVQSGFFNDSKTWKDNIVPYSSGFVYIPPGINVIISRQSLRSRLSRIEVAGILTVGGGNSEFEFTNRLTLIILNGGVLQDMTTTKTILLEEGSVYFQYPNGSTSDDATSIQSFSKTSRANNRGVRVRLRRRGVFTCGVVSITQVLSYNSFAFIAFRSGSFLSSSTYIGNFGISASICAAVGGCSYVITSGVTVSTSELNGVLSINVFSLTVLSGGIFQMGSSGSSSGFRFSTAIIMSIFGQLSYIGSGGSILLPSGSTADFYSGGGFISTVTTSLSIYSSANGVVSIISSTTWATSFFGPIFHYLSSSNTISISIEGPNGTPTTTVASVTGSMG